MPGEPGKSFQCDTLFWFPAAAKQVVNIKTDLTLPREIIADCVVNDQNIFMIPLPLKMGEIPQYDEDTVINPNITVS